MSMRFGGFVAFMGAIAALSSSPTLAQDAAPTAGGDVSASDASVLPPIEVTSPSEPVRKKRNGGQPSATAGTTTQDSSAENGSGEAWSNGGAPAAPSQSTAGVFTLGQLDILGGSTINNEAMWAFQKSSLDKAINILPGVNLQPAQGSRNESNVYVRGFDRFRVPLSVDGVRMYLPADNRLDFSRFLTPDIAEVEVQKGYVSVLNGAGGLGGAINLVSRKPTKALELEGRTGITTNRDADGIGAWNGYAYAGTKRDTFYGQVSGTIVDQDYFSLSNDFTPRTLVNEDGGARNNSEFRDWRLNVKAGLTPNTTDEYSLNFTEQHGSKSAPLHIIGERNVGTGGSAQRYWKWPEWDLSSLSFLSKTQLGDRSYVKTNVFYNTFTNTLKAYDNATYTTQSNPPAFTSPYDDDAYGGSLELGTRLGSFDDIKIAAHYRHDVHREGDFIRPTSATFAAQEPQQKNVEDTWSIGLENTLHLTRSLDFVTGASYDRLNVDLAEAYQGTAPNGTLVQQDTPNFDAWNYQGALVYSYSRTGKAHASVSDRARFATVFERYSTRFGTTSPNPNIAPERATNYEIGFRDSPLPDLKFSGALFFADLSDSIQYVTRQVGNNQYENVDGRHYGLEVSFDYDLTSMLRVGGNYSYLERDLDFATTGAMPEGTPRHRAFVYLAWKPTDRLSIIPSYEYASDRFSVDTSRKGPAGLNVPYYTYAGSYDLVNLEIEYKFDDNFTAAVGGTNLLDHNYELVEGFPQAGRQFFANLRAKF